MNYPEIRFSNPYLLIGAIRPDIEGSYEARGKLRMLDSDYIDKKIEEYEAIWRPHERRILSGICGVLDLEFRQNVIDVYIAPFRSSFSDPLFISTKLDAERAREVIAHELVHRLLFDNTASVKYEDRVADWRRMFGEDYDIVTIYHIPVHATLSALYNDILNEPERVKRDIELVAAHPAYRDSWAYVQEHGYRTIINQLRESYKRLSD